MAKDLLLLLSGAVSGFLALLLVHLLPVKPMQEHVYWSLPMIEKEFEDEVVVEGYRSTLTGNFTDCLMLEYAVYEPQNHSLVEQVLRMYRSESCALEDGWWPGRSLKDYLENVPAAREVEYARYWHGYLVILKPLLLLTSFNTIRLMNSALQVLMAGLVVMGFCRKNASPLAMGFLLSLPFLFFISTYASLSLSICYYVMVLSLLLQLRFDSSLHSKELYGAFFLITGMAASYFDLLTYPLITLVFPLCTYLYFHGEAPVRSLKKICQYSLEWFFGYIGLWGSKWLLSDLLTGGSTIKDAFSTLRTRTGSAAGYSRISGFFNVLWKNIEPFSNWCYVILIAMAFVILLFQMTRSRGGKNIKSAIPYMLLALYPLLWLFVTQNHSEQHWQFTCRIFACSVFSVYAGCEKMLQHGKNANGDGCL
ncbi:MAG: hypothetical protein NC517_00460 [Firmicutes bacterium]|nr:hypothetical protein [Bacillota bacterium]